MGAPHTLTCAPAAPTLVRAGRRISCLTRAERAEFGASSSVRARLGLWRSSVVHRGRGRGRPIVGVDGQFRAWAVNGSRDVEGGETAGRGDCGEEEKAVARARAGEREEELLIGNMADLLNLEKQFAFYGAYHSNKLNVLVHMFFVWPIFFTSGILWAYTPAIIPLPLPAGGAAVTGFRQAVEKKTEENIAIWKAEKAVPSQTTPLLCDRDVEDDVGSGALPP